MHGETLASESGAVGAGPESGYSEEAPGEIAAVMSRSPYQTREDLLHRLDRDVLSQSGARSVVVLEGINDINSDTPAADVIDGLKQIAATARSCRLRAVVGTLIPTGGCTCTNPAREAAREKVNDFIRHSDGAFDAVVDFDAAIRDPANPQAMPGRYDSGDHLHPNGTGYQAMAEAVDLHRL